MSRERLIEALFEGPPHPALLPDSSFTIDVDARRRPRSQTSFNGAILVASVFVERVVHIDDEPKLVCGSAVVVYADVRRDRRGARVPRAFFSAAIFHLNAGRLRVDGFLVLSVFFVIWLPIWNGSLQFYSSTPFLFEPSRP